MAIENNLLEELLHEEEGTTIDFKKTQYKFRDAQDAEKSELLKDILAFCNAWRHTDAYIIIGVEEVKGARAKPIGVTEHLGDADIQQFVNSKTNKPVQLSVHTVTVDGVQIDIVKIPIQDRPIYLPKSFGKISANAVPIRRGSSTTYATPEEIAQIGNARASVENEHPRLVAGLVENIIHPFSTSQSLQLIEKTCSVKIPDYPFNQSYAFAILADANSHTPKNRNYYRDCFEYLRKFSKALKLHVTLENAGVMTARDIAIELLFESTIDNFAIFSESEMPTLPVSGLVAISAAGATMPPASDVAVIDEKHLHKVEAHLEYVQAKRVWISKSPLYLFAGESGTVQVNATVFATGLPSPIKTDFMITVEHSKEEFDIYGMIKQLGLEAHE